MSESRAAPYLGGLRGLATLIGLISAVSGLMSSSTIVALNTLGIIGLPVLVVAFVFRSEIINDEDKETGSIIVIIIAVLVLIGSIVYFGFGRPLDEDERAFNILTILGGISLVIGALILSPLAKRILEPPRKICPDCANSVLAAARKCQYCNYRFDIAES